MILVLSLLNSYCNAWSFPDRRPDAHSTYTDTIRTQADFDKLLKKAAEKNNINAYLEAGSYIVSKSQPVYTKFYLSGNDVIITQKNRVFTREDAIRETETHYVCPAEGIKELSLFVDEEGNTIPVAEDVDSLTKINIVNEDIIRNDTVGARNVRRIKIRIPDRLAHLRNLAFDKAFGYVDSWFSAPSFKVRNSDSAYFYCTLTERRLPEEYDTYVNGEKAKRRQDISLVIYNVTPLPGKVFFDKKFLYIPKEYDRIEVVDPNSSPMFMLKEDAEVRFDGIRIEDCTNVFRINEKANGVRLVNCSFHNILSQVLGTKIKVNLFNVSIERCYFSNYAFIDRTPLIYISAPECLGRITDCIFNQYESGFCFYKSTMENIYINRCKEFEIKDNVFINSTRGALFLTKGKIVVESNEFYNDPVFNSYPQRNFSRDAGAIYCSKLYVGESRIRDDNPNKIYLRLNKIHDFYGKGDVRGIFIDDGRGDVTCYGNLIFGGQHCSIISWVPNDDPYSSIRNKYEYNIVAYPYQLTYGDSIVAKDRPVLDHNILLFTDKKCKATTPSTTDIRVADFEIDGNEVMVGRDIWKRLPKDVRSMVKPLKKIK